MNPWERLVGPGATRAENIGTIGVGVAGAVVAIWRAVAVDASALATITAAVLALDVVGGVWANATETTRRWYHRPGSGPRSHLGFASAHVHPFILALLFEGFALQSGVVLYVGVVLTTGLIQVSPDRLASPIALTASLALIVALTGNAAGLEWFPAAYTLKLLAGHAVPARSG